MKISNFKLYADKTLSTILVSGFLVTASIGAANICINSERKFADIDDTLATTTYVSDLNEEYSLDEIYYVRIGEDKYICSRKHKNGMNIYYDVNSGNLVTSRKVSDDERSTINEILRRKMDEGLLQPTDISVTEIENGEVCHKIIAKK